MKNLFKKITGSAAIATLVFLAGCDILEDAAEQAQKTAEDIADAAENALDSLEEQTEIGKELVEIDPSEIGEDDIMSVGNYKVSNFGGGADSKTDNKDYDNLKIVQHFPKNNSQVYPGSVMQIFFNDVILIPSIENSIIIKRNGSPVEGEINLNPDKLGGSILTFSPRPAFAEGDSYTVSVSTSLRDNGDKPLDSKVSFGFTVGSRPSGFCDGAFDSASGIIFEGDGAIKEGTSKIPASSGSYAVISTSNSGAVSGTSAINNSTSRMICFPEDAVTNLSFQYNFVSGEFIEWVDSPYDDTAMITISDSEGKTITQTITSVKGIGKNGTSDAGDFYNLDEETNKKDGYFGQTGWKAQKISFARTLTPPVTITFSVQDVADDIVDSALIVDEMTFE